MGLKLLKIVGLCLCFQVSFSQEDVLPHLIFWLQDDQGTVHITWEVAAHETCEEVSIYRGDDSLNLQHIYTYPGICGGGAQAETYHYRDNSTLEGRTCWYQLRVYTDRKPVQKITLPPLQEIQVAPNPARSNARLFFNPEAKIRALRVYRPDGRLYHRETGDLEFPHELEVHDWPSGIYIISLQHQKGQWTTRLQIE